MVVPGHPGQGGRTLPGPLGSPASVRTRGMPSGAAPWILSPLRCSGGGRRRWPTSLSGGGPADWPLAVALAGSRVAWTWTHVHLSQAACSCQWLSLAFPMTVAADRGDPCHQERCLGVRREFCQSQSQGWTPRAPSSAPGGRVVCSDHGPSGPALPIFIPGGSCCPALWLVPFSWCLHVQKRTEVLTNI